MGFLGWGAIGSGIALGLLGRRCAVSSGGAVGVWWQWLAIAIAGGLVWIAWQRFLVSLFLDCNFCECGVENIYFFNLVLGCKYRFLGVNLFCNFLIENMSRH